MTFIPIGLNEAEVILSAVSEAGYKADWTIDNVITTGTFVRIEKECIALWANGPVWVYFGNECEFAWNQQSGIVGLKMNFNRIRIYTTLISELPVPASATLLQSEGTINFDAFKNYYKLDSKRTKKNKYMQYRNITSGDITISNSSVIFKLLKKDQDEAILTWLERASDTILPFYSIESLYKRYSEDSQFTYTAVPTPLLIDAQKTGYLRVWKDQFGQFIYAQESFYQLIDIKYRDCVWTVHPFLTPNAVIIQLGNYFICTISLVGSQDLNELHQNLL